MITEERMKENTYKHKAAFVAFVEVNNANPNASADSNEPRQNNEGFGEISKECISHKIRCRLQEMGERIFVQSDDLSDDGCKSLSERADMIKDAKDADDFARKSAECFTDIRLFGCVHAYKDKSGFSSHVTGAVSIRLTESVAPVEINEHAISKCVNSEKTENNEKASDTFGGVHYMVRHGLYKIQGSINKKQAERNGVTEHDVEMLKEALRTLFVNDASAARPEGSMRVVSVYWYEYDPVNEEPTSYTVHKSVNAILKEGVDIPRSADDYDIVVTPIEGLTPEVIKGI